MIFGKLISHIIVRIIKIDSYYPSKFPCIPLATYYTNSSEKCGSVFCSHNCTISKMSSNQMWYSVLSLILGVNNILDSLPLIPLRADVPHYCLPYGLQYNTVEGLVTTEGLHNSGGKIGLLQLEGGDLRSLLGSCSWCWE